MRFLLTEKSVQPNLVFLNPNMTLKNRLQLLTEAEIEDLYARPDFNAAERELYFSINRPELNALSQYSTTKTQVAFILQLGYFKAKQQFFAFTLDDVQDDVAYLLAKYYKFKKATLSNIVRQVLSKQKNVILNLFGYRSLVQEGTEFTGTPLQPFTRLGYS